MKIIAINGSPRASGNTAKMCAEFLAGAKANGAETEYFHLEGLKIHGCLSCMECQNNDGVCAINDDMQTLYRAVQESSALILAFPVYMWQMSGQTKLFMDRLFAFFRRDFSSLLKGKKKLFLGMTQGNPDAEKFRPYAENTLAMLEFVGFSPAGILIAAGTHDTADILRQPEILTKAKETGALLASTL